jgi:hypothetical protein
MRNLVFILLLFPTLLSAQKDSSVQTFRIGGCKALIAGKYFGDKKNASLADLLKTPTVEVTGCGDSMKVISFHVVINSNGIINDITTLGSIFTKEMISTLKQAIVGSTVMFYNVKYKVQDSIMTVPVATTLMLQNVK